MPRTIHANVVAALASDYYQRCILVKIDFERGAEYWTDFGHDIVYDGNTYNAASSFIQVSGINDSSGITVGGFTVKAQNVDRSILAVLMGQNISGRRVDVWEAVVDSDGTILNDPVVLKSNARIASYSSQTGKQSATVVITCASHWANFQTQNGRYSTLASQKRHFPLDTGLKNASETTNTKSWGSDS